MSELGPEARTILEDGRGGDDPMPADRARIRASLMRALATGGGAGAAAGEGAAGAGAAKAGVLSIAGKLLAAVVVLAALGVALARLRGAPHAALPAVETAVAVSPVEPPPADVTMAPPPATPVVAVEAPPSPSTAPSSPPPRPATPALSPRPSVSSVPSTVPVASAAPVATVAPVAADAPTTTSPPEDTLPVETQRLREANGALKGGDPARALALLDEQRAGGVELRQERAAARVLALCQLGRAEEARAAAARFLQESPRSPLADRVRAACAAR